MLYWAYILFAVAFAAGIMGFGGTSSQVAGIAQMAFFVFLFASVVIAGIAITRGDRERLD